MNQMLRIGQTVTTDRQVKQKSYSGHPLLSVIGGGDCATFTWSVRESSRLPCDSDQFLGSGRQGEVHRAKLSGSLAASKQYFPDSATAQQRVGNVDQGGPPTNRFLRPMDLVFAADVAGAGGASASEEHETVVI
jgi:hypothetical protein